MTARQIGPFKDYHDAYDAAVEDARRYRCDVGLEKVDAPGFSEHGYFRLFFLPKPNNRCGHELRCEVVTTESPRTIRLYG